MLVFWVRIRAVKKLVLDVGPEFLQNLRDGINADLLSRFFQIVANRTGVGIVEV